MSEPAPRDFLALIARPTLAYEEGLRFFRGVGLMNDTLRRLARDLEKLVELKLAFGLTGAGRRRDLADVQELIRIQGLDAACAERLDPSARDIYHELWAELPPPSGEPAWGSGPVTRGA